MSPVTSPQEKIELQNTFFQAALDIVQPYLNSSEDQSVPSTLAEEDRRLVVRAGEMLKRVIELDPDNWSAMWFLGRSYAILDLNEEAYGELSRAYRMQPQNPEVGRHLISACLKLEKDDEALNVSAAVLSIEPADAGHIANHALVLLQCGRLQEALSAIERSLQISPGEAVSQKVHQLVQERRRGQESPP